MEQAVHLPYIAYLEAIGDAFDAGLLFEPTVAVGARGALYFWFTTATAFQISLTARFCDGLVERGGLSEARRGDVELALHEAVANALLHGNLGLVSEMRDDFRQYATFCRLLDERLRDPVAGKARIEVAATWADGVLDISVSDQGLGYAEAATPPPPSEKGLPLHGLGIIHAIAQSVATGNEGRRLTMRFAA